MIFVQLQSTLKHIDIDVATRDGDYDIIARDLIAVEKCRGKCHSPPRFSDELEPVKCMCDGAQGFVFAHRETGPRQSLEDRERQVSRLWRNDGIAQAARQFGVAFDLPRAQ